MATILNFIYFCNAFFKFKNFIQETAYMYVLTVTGNIYKNVWLKKNNCRRSTISKIVFPKIPSASNDPRMKLNTASSGDPIPHYQDSLQVMINYF